MRTGAPSSGPPTETSNTKPRRSLDLTYLEHGKPRDIGGRAMRRSRAEVNGASEAESHPAYEVLTDWTRAVWEKDVYGHHARFHDDRHGNQRGPHPPSARRQRATSASAAWQPVDTRLLACRRAAARAALSRCRG